MKTTPSSHVRGLLCLILAAVVLLSVPSEAAAQDAEDQEAQHVYVAYFKIGFADLGEWIDLYHEHAVPVLQELQEEGVIVGWNVWQHSTGGEYNWRFGIRTAAWPQLGQFWSEYLTRLQERSPEASERTSAMIQAHYDEVWNLTEVHVPDPAPDTKYIYDSRFQVGFADLGEWDRTWIESVGPVLDQAMEDGLLGGWVVEGHNTGGRYNWKVIYFFEEWDDMDDFFDRVLSHVMADAALWDRISSMITAHDDVIWATVPDPTDG